MSHYGICSSSSKIKSAITLKEQLPVATSLFGGITKAAPEPYNPKRCPCCQKETMATLMRFNRRGPPGKWKEMAVELLEGIKTLDVTSE